MLLTFDRALLYALNHFLTETRGFVLHESGRHPFDFSLFMLFRSSILCEFYFTIVSSVSLIFPPTSQNSQILRSSFESFFLRSSFCSKGIQKQFRRRIDRWIEDKSVYYRSWRVSGSSCRFHSLDECWEIGWWGVKPGWDSIPTGYRLAGAKSPGWEPYSVVCCCLTAHIRNFSISASCIRFAFARRFWNQIFTCNNEPVRVCYSVTALYRALTARRFCPAVFVAVSEWLVRRSRNG